METVQSRIDNSRNYLGSGTYEALQPVITEYGMQLGWRYVYPLGIAHQGVPFRNEGYTLDSLEACGIIELKKMKITLV